MTAFTILVAISENGVISKDNKIPWDNPADQKRMYEYIKDKAIICGYKTALQLRYSRNNKSYGYPLLTGFPMCYYPDSDREILQDFPYPVASLAEAKRLFRYARLTDPEMGKLKDEICILGGQQLYQEAVGSPLVNKIIVTIMSGTYEGDRFFPKLDLKIWEETNLMLEKDATIRIYQRKHSK